MTFLAHVLSLMTFRTPLPTDLHLSVLLLLCVRHLLRTEVYEEAADLHHIRSAFVV